MVGTPAEEVVPIDGASTPARVPKLAERVAQQIEQDIIARGWPVGEQLGTEATLAESLGVSRGVIREAVRILEHHMAVAPRRGLGGGVVVTRPDIAAVIPVIDLYLDSVGVSPATLLEARSAIELSAVSLTAERITAEGQERLHAALMREQSEMADPHRYVLSHDLHILIAELSGNAALRLFVSVLTRLTSDHSQQHLAAVRHADLSAIGQDISKAHVKIVDAIVKGNAPLAQRRMLTHLQAVTGWLV